MDKSKEDALLAVVFRKFIESSATTHDFDTAWFEVESGTLTIDGSVHLTEEEVEAVGSAIARIKGG